MHQLQRALSPFFIAIFIVCTSIVHAGAPLWTFTPDTYYPSTISITPMGLATIQYQITNQSHKTRTLVMKPITGITQITTAGNCSERFILAYQQSCTLSLLVHGDALISDIKGGPVVCPEGSSFECYQPSLANALNITRIPNARYVITPTAQANGSITPASPQTVLAGSNLLFTATPAPSYYVDEWIIDDGIAQKGGDTFALTNILANHDVEVTFTQTGTIYAGTQSGFVYFSTDNGQMWSVTTAPSPGFSVNSVYATVSTLYAASEDHKVYYSNNNGVSWSATNPVLDNQPVDSVFVTSTSKLYAGTHTGSLYYSTDAQTWTAVGANPGAGAVNSIFITPNNTIYVGSNDGNVYYSLNDGASWTVIHGPTTAPISNVFATNNQLYINTRKVTSNSTLPPNTVDFEYAYSSNSLTAANPTWTLFSQITYSLFVNSDASIIHAGTQDGYVFSLTSGNELGFITYSPINSLFFLG